MGPSDVRIETKDKLPLMKCLAFFLGKRFMTDFFTTYRIPFCSPVIACPVGVNTARVHLDYAQTMRHEMYHVRQFAPWYGPIWMLLLVALVPLPILWSGRWLVEREAYLSDIRHGADLEAVVQVLWHDYGWCWPTPLMRRWFYKQLRSRGTR